MAISYSLPRVLVILVLLLRAALADLTCTQYIPKGSRSSKGKVNFSGSSGSYVVAPINASVTTPVSLDIKHPSGTQFQFESCNSTTLGLKSSVYFAGCNHSGCQSYYFNYIRIINPKSGHCLTSRPLGKSNSSELVPQNCNASPKNASQLYLASQEQTESNDPGTPAIYGAANIYPYDALGPYSSPSSQYPYNSWYLAADHKTILYYSWNGSVTYLNAIATI